MEKSNKQEQCINNSNGSDFVPTVMTHDISMPSKKFASGGNDEWLKYDIIFLYKSSGFLSSTEIR